MSYVCNSMLTKYQIESELSLAYLHAVAAKAGYAIDVPAIDNDSVDAIISARGRVDTDSIAKSPKIDVQLKATINWAVNNRKEIPYKLNLKNYNELRGNTMVPRLLVLLCLPSMPVDWLIHHQNMLIMQNCAYYLNLKNYPESNNTQKQTVYFPVKQRLSPKSLKRLMLKASKYQDL